MYLVTNLLISAVVCYFLTKNKSMSFGWGWFFSICFSLLVGIILIVSSNEYGKSTKKPFSSSTKQKVKVIVYLLLGGLLLYGAAAMWPKYEDYEWDYASLQSAITCLALGIGFIGSAIYIYSDADTYVYESLDYPEEAPIISE